MRKDAPMINLKIEKLKTAKSHETKPIKRKNVDRMISIIIYVSNMNFIFCIIVII